MREELAVNVERYGLLVRRGHSGVEVLPGEVRHLVNALVDRAVKLVDWRSRERGSE